MHALTAARRDLLGLSAFVAAMLLAGLLIAGCGGSSTSESAEGATLSGMEVEMHFDPG